MNIAVPIAAYEEGTTGEYVARAFRNIGHTAKTLSQWEFYNAFNGDNYDLYFCVDSGGPLNLFEGGIVNGPWHKLAFWMIDYRRGKTLKNPNDWDTCKFIDTMGGWVFQAQYEDFIDCMNRGLRNVSWLPLGADTEVWSNTPEMPKVYDVGFVGNVWDNTRNEILGLLKIEYGSRLGFLGHGAARMANGAAVLRSSKVGFNISSFYGEPIAFDVNMRVFETLACGVPLITNYVPSLERLGLFGQPFVVTYRSIDELLITVRNASRSESFVASGDKASEWALQGGTYNYRMQLALQTVNAKILKPKWEQI